MFYRDQKATSPIRKRILSLLRATGYVKIQLGEPPLWRLLDPLGEHQLFLPAMDGGPLIWSVGLQLAQAEVDKVLARPARASPRAWA